MDNHRLATVDRHAQLYISDKQHHVSWLRDHRQIPCVAEILRRGLVRISPLDVWAQVHAMSSEEATQALAESEASAPFDEWSGSCLCVATRKVQPGRPIHELRLPDIVIFALFNQGEGPLNVRKGGGGDHGKVILVAQETFLELWSQSLL